MIMHSHHDSVQTQFDPRAQDYLTSAVHAQGPDLEYARAQIANHVSASGAALDVGCGAGHLAFAVATLVARTMALDPSPNMLNAVATEATARGLPTLETCQGHAAALPFADSSFDFVCTRYSAHHWTTLGDALIEMRRVLKPAGQLLVIDVLGDEDPLVDTHLQAIELLRDPSHVRDRSCTEWQAALDAAGFTIGEERSWPLRLDFAAWIARMRTPEVHVAALRALQAGAPIEVKRALAYADDGSFTCTTGAFWARRRD
jgi:ubiquinone/menaquinone biosynthesis C-methylase UbiE